MVLTRWIWKIKSRKHHEGERKYSEIPINLVGDLTKNSRTCPKGQALSGIAQIRHVIITMKAALPRAEGKEHKGHFEHLKFKVFYYIARDL